MEVIAAVFESVLSVIAKLLGAFISLFVEGTASLGLLDLLLLLLVLSLELLFWIALYLIELLRSIFSLRLPKRIEKPVLWRPKRLEQDTVVNED